MTTPGVSALPTCRGASDDLLCDGAGRPVFSTRTPQEERALVRAGEVLGFVLEHVDEPRRATDRDPPDAIVLGIGAEAREPSRLYAHLTHRAWRWQPTPPSEVEDAVEVVVTTRDHYSNALLHALYGSGGPPRAPGLVLAANEADLHLQALLRAASLHGRRSFEASRMDLLPGVPFDRIEHPHGLAVGGRAAAQGVRRALRQGAEVLGIWAHGDGIDGYLHDDLSLCPMARDAAVRDPSRSPTCFRDQRCPRHAGVSIAEGFASQTLLSPDQISARVLVWASCAGLPLPFDALDPGFVAGHLLSLQPSLGALITTWEVSLIDIAILPPLFDALVRGEPVGAAVGAFNHSEVAQRAGLRLCVVGDPSLRSLRPSRVPLPVAFDSTSHRDLGPRTSREGEEAMLVHALSARCATQARGKGQEQAKEAEAACTRYLHAVWSRLPLSDVLEARQQLRTKTLALGCARGWLSVDWMPFAEIELDPASHRCPTCGLECTSFVAALQIPGPRDRQVRLCPRCGLIADTPRSSPLALRVERDRVVLSGVTFSDDWDGRLSIWSHVASDGVVVPWPADDDGRPCRSVGRAEDWPRGLVHASSFFMVGTSLSFLHGRGAFHAGKQP